jgi:transposase-like protein
VIFGAVAEGSWESTTSIISSDACKGLAAAVREVYPWAKHRECFLHLMRNFSKKFHGPVYDRMWPAARTYKPEYHEYYMNKIYAASKAVKPYLDKDHHLIWMRSRFSEEIKVDHITNNAAEV